MKRKPGVIYAGDRDHPVKLTDGTWEKLGREALARGMSRARLARRLLEFALDAPDLIDVIFDVDAIAEEAL